MAWGLGKSDMLKLLAREPYTEHRQSSETWKIFWNTRPPPFLKDFVYQSLWHKLKVGERLMSWTHEPPCPICHKFETVDHALSGCQFHALVYDALDQSWAPVTRGNKRHTVHTLPVALTLATPVGIMLWTARAAHWSLRCATCQNAAAPTFEAFIKALVTFVEKVAAWQGLSPLV